jgi:hypothetical protein
MEVTKLVIVTEVSSSKIKECLGVRFVSRLVESIDEEISHDPKDFRT